MRAALDAVRPRFAELLGRRFARDPRALPSSACTYAGAPSSLQVLSIRREDGQESELQDAHVYDFGNGPRVLAVKNAEGFAVLDPEDGL